MFCIRFSARGFANTSVLVALTGCSRRGLADRLLGDGLVSCVVDAYRVLLGGPRTPPLSLTVNNGLQMDWTTRIGIFSMVGRNLSHFGYRHEVGLSEPPRL